MSSFPPPKMSDLLIAEPSEPAEEPDVPDPVGSSTCVYSSESIGHVPAQVVDELKARISWSPDSGAAWSDKGVGAFRLAVFGSTKEVPAVSKQAMLDSVDKIATKSGSKKEGKVQATKAHLRMAQLAGFRGAQAARCNCIDALMTLSHCLILDIKARLGVPRPTELRPGLGALIPVPQTKSYPGGHAFQSALLYRFMSALEPGKEQQLLRRARRIAEVREELGLHCKVDTEAGWDLGLFLGGQLLDEAAKNPSSAWGKVYAAAQKE